MKKRGRKRYQEKNRPGTQCSWYYWMGIKFKQFFGDWRVLIWCICGHVPLSMLVTVQNGRFYFAIKMPNSPKLSPSKITSCTLNDVFVIRLLALEEERRRLHEEEQRRIKEEEEEERKRRAFEEEKRRQEEAAAAAERQRMKEEEERMEEERKRHLREEELKRKERVLEEERKRKEREEKRQKELQQRLQLEEGGREKEGS